ncbi:hypothetical protein SULYE_0736 [Sulfurihydrogenibium yellowstonense SS-5]|uniref:Uncharacterized protein n=1 Tax=Sulfurihydrogenibium yellowstonense SS-5 TaxID=432331 RepID=C4FJI9_9AQUI|nr:hypothetical protein SULYE_0736 [Sulfurihydrogenibium yellowstonense SS-5]
MFEKKYSIIMLYNPHGSDVTASSVALHIATQSFITHTVQM